MIPRGVLTLAGATLLGIVFGAVIGWAIGTVAPATYYSHIFGAHDATEANRWGLDSA